MEAPRPANAAPAAQVEEMTSGPQRDQVIVGRLAMSKLDAKRDSPRLFRLARLTLVARNP